MKLGDVCDFEGGSQPPKSKFVYEEKPGYVRFLQIRDFGSDKNITFIPQSKKNRLCEENDILIGRYGASVGKILTDKAGAYNVAMMKTIPNLEVLDRSWFYNYLISDEFQNRLLNVAARSAQNGFSKDDIYGFPVPVPARAVQQRIVGILEEAFNGIAIARANAEKNLQNARALFESHLQAVFTQRGEGWVERTIGEACILRSGTTLPKEIEKPSGEIPYLKVADMNISENLNGVTCSSRYVNKGDVNASNLLPVGTTIFPKRGGAILTNKKRLTTRIICADLNIMGVSPKRGLLPEFLFNFFLRLDLREINNGSSIPQINNYSIEPLLIAFPELVMEQQAIVNKLALMSDETQRLESIYRQKLGALAELKKSLLHQAFSGQLIMEN